MDQLKSNGHILAIYYIFFPYSGGHNEALPPGRYPILYNFLLIFFYQDIFRFAHIVAVVRTLNLLTSKNRNNIISLNVENKLLSGDWI